MSYDEPVRRARVLFYEPEYFLLEFRSCNGERVDEIVWAADSHFPATPIIISKTPIQDARADGQNWPTSESAAWLGGLLLLAGFLAFVIRPTPAVSRRTQSDAFSEDMKVPLQQEEDGERGDI